MRTGLCLLAMICIALPLPGQNDQKKIQGTVSLGYELYSWQKGSGEWDFCILYTTNIEKTVRQVFDEKTTLHGPDELKRKLDTLPEGTRVHWLDRVPLGASPKAKGSERLSYPTKDVIQDIRRYAERRDVKIMIHGSPDGLP
jgi:hypothetical protein